MDRVFIVSWSVDIDKGILGVFSSRDKAENAIDMDKERYPEEDYGYCEYTIEMHYVDEVEQ